MIKIVTSRLKILENENKRNTSNEWKKCLSIKFSPKTSSNYKTEFNVQSKAEELFSTIHYITFRLPYIPVIKLKWIKHF